jgi:uncharacterized SAM-binding protein YcdF (DUF218 family)
MFFILSKVLLILTEPFFWILIAIAWAFITKKTIRRKRLLYIALVLFLLFSNPYVMRTFTRYWDMPSQNVVGKTFSCAIVLGGFTSVGDDGKGYFNGAGSRFIEALKLKVSGSANKILVSGGSGLLTKGSNFKEADVTAEQFRILHIPDSVVLLENRSRNTMENALFSKKVLADKKIAGPYLLVTSAFHMRRALYTFKKAGLDVVAYSSDYSADNGDISFNDIIPSVEVLDKWDIYTKEIFGYIVYHVKSF